MVVVNLFLFRIVVVLEKRCVDCISFLRLLKNNSVVYKKFIGYLIILI